MSITLTTIEIALLNHYKFETTIGQLTVEDLYTLPLKSKTKLCLDDIAISLDSKLRSTEQKSFVDDTTKVNVELQNKLEIVKRVIEIKKDEMKRKIEHESKTTQRNLIMQEIERRKTEDMLKGDLTELESRLKELQ